MDSLTKNQYLEFELSENEINDALRIAIRQNGFNELTEDEEAEALRAARERKFYAKRTREYWDKINRPIVYPSYNSLQMFAFVQSKAQSKYHKQIEIYEKNEAVIDQLNLYFSNDNEFETKYGMSLKKGLLLHGNVGRGKTWLMKLYSENQNRSFMVMDSREINFEYADEGFNVVKRYSSVINSVRDHFGNREYGLCIDDFGTEEERKHYADRANAVLEVLSSRFNKLPGNYTHLTTNLSLREIEDNYGSRIRSRLHEMFNFIVYPVDSKDYRRE